jgi:MoxR-like ATPase
MSAPVITTRIGQLSRQLCAGLHEREETMMVALLAVFAGQSVFLLGPPGTAKSLLARRLSGAFRNAQHFEYLMQKFSTPEEIFGPIDISELKQGNYKRKTKGYLPTADFAFLDEIWKSNPAILNTLLTITNEKTFRNGDTVEQAPLKALIGASNEIPQSGQGLEALWDRFVVRLEVPPLTARANFEALLQSARVKADSAVDAKLAVSTEEWQRWQSEIDTVRLSAETLHIIHAVKVQLNELETQRNADSHAQAQSLYVSDRRWLRAVMLVKASAYFSGRAETMLLDTLMLRHCLWSSLDNRAQIDAALGAAILANLSPEFDVAEADVALSHAEASLVNMQSQSLPASFDFAEASYAALPEFIQQVIPTKIIQLQLVSETSLFIALDENKCEIPLLGKLKKINDSQLEWDPKSISDTDSLSGRSIGLMPIPSQVMQSLLSKDVWSGKFSGSGSPPAIDTHALVKRLMKLEDGMVALEHSLTEKLAYAQSAVAACLLSSNQSLWIDSLQLSLQQAHARTLQTKRLIALALNPKPAENQNISKSPRRVKEIAVKPAAAWPFLFSPGIGKFK